MIIIPVQLKKLVENWLRKQTLSLEQGGFFFASSEGLLGAFLPCPNFSKNPSTKFDRGNGQYYAKLFSEMIGMKTIAEMHTHPSGRVVSEQDLRYVRAHSYPYEIVIIIDEKAFTWQVIDNEGHPVGIVESDEQLEKAVYFLAQDFSVTDLGRASVTPRGELLTTSGLGKALLSLDQDAYRVWRFKEEGQGRFSWQSPTQKDMADSLGISKARLKRALDKLEDLEERI